MEGWGSKWEDEYVVAQVLFKLVPSWITKKEHLTQHS